MARDEDAHVSVLAPHRPHLLQNPWQARTRLPLPHSGAFQANPKYLIDITLDAAKLDLTGFRLEFRRLGQVIMSMDEDFKDIPEGLAVQWAVQTSVVPRVRFTTDVSAGCERSRRATGTPGSRRTS